MCQEKQRLEECAVGDYVKCSNAIEVESGGNTLFFPKIPYADMNTWRFERRLMSRIMEVPPSPSASWSDPDKALKVDTFMVWVRVN